MKFLVFSLVVLVAISLAKHKHLEPKVTKNPIFDLGIVKPVRSMRMMRFINELRGVATRDLADTLGAICENGTLALSNGIDDNDVHNLVKVFELEFRKFGMELRNIFFTGRLLLTRSHLAGMRNGRQREDMCLDLTYEELYPSSDEIDDTPDISDDTSISISESMNMEVEIPVLLSDRAILCLLRNTGRYLEEAVKSADALEDEMKNAPPVTCSKLDTSLSYTPTEILTIFLDDLECFRGHILHICEEIKYAKSMAKVSDFKSVRHAVVKSMMLFVTLIGEATETLFPLFTMVYANVPQTDTTNDTMNIFELMTRNNLMTLIPATY